MENQFYDWCMMLTTNLHYVEALFNPYLLGEDHLLDDANAGWKHE
jgi:hypothetical protein